MIFTWTIHFTFNSFNDWLEAGVCLGYGSNNEANAGAEGHQEASREDDRADAWYHVHLD